MFESSILIVAHPDDEILWFSSILNRVDKILVCFVDAPSPHHTTTDGRRRVLLDYPLKNLSTLGIPEPALFGAGNWRNPVITEFGLKVRRKASERSMRSFYELRKLLRPQLALYRNVFTHNPWGDYGHEEHVLLYHVVHSLKRELGFSLWFSNYCSNRSLCLLMRYMYAYISHYITFETERELANDIANLYRKHGCWTWHDDWQAFREESFLESSSLTSYLASGREWRVGWRLFPRDVPRRSPGRGHLFPLNLMRIDW